MDDVLNSVLSRDHLRSISLNGRIYDLDVLLFMGLNRAVIKMPVEELTKQRFDVSPDIKDGTSSMLVFRSSNRWIVLSNGHLLIDAIANGRDTVKVRRLGILPKAIPRTEEYRYTYASLRNSLPAAPPVDVFRATHTPIKKSWISENAMAICEYSKMVSMAIAAVMAIWAILKM